MREEEEERVRSENIDVESILQDDNDDYLAQREHIKVDTRPTINHLFKCNLEVNNCKYQLFDLANCLYHSINKLMKKYIILNYTTDNNNVSSNYIG